MRASRGWWAQNFLQAEFWLAVALTLMLIAWSEHWEHRPALAAMLDGNRGPLYGALISLHGALMGFVIATAAIVLGLVTTKRFSVLHASSQYTTLWKVFTSSARVLGLAALCALVGLLVDRDSQPRMAAFYVAAGTSLLAILRLGRCVWALEAIIDIATSKPAAPRP